MELDGETLRYLVVIGTTPFWWPFLRELYREMNGALREDGGLLGKSNSPDHFRGYVSPLSNTPFRDGSNRSAGAPPTAAQAQAGGELPSRQQGGGSAAPRTVRTGGFKR